MHGPFRIPRGFSLIEAAIVLGVVGLIIGGIWIAAASYMNEQKAAKAAEQIMMIAKNIQTRISSRDASTFANATNITTFAIDSGAIPADMLRGSNARNIYGGSIGLTSYNTSPPLLRFDIYSGSVPRAGCIQMLIKLSRLGAASAPEFANVSGPMSRPGLGYLGTNSNAWSTMVFPVSLTTAETACNLDTNQVITTFGYAQ